MPSSSAGDREDGAGARHVRGSVEVASLGDQRPQSGAPGRSSRDEGRCPWLGGRNAGAAAHHHGPEVGKARTTPLTFFRDGTDLVVIASNGGADRPPDWSLNLQQTPRAVVEIGTDRLVVDGSVGVGAGTRAAVGRGHGDVRRLRPLPGTDNATDTGHPSHTRRPAGRTSVQTANPGLRRTGRRLRATTLAGN